MVTKRQFFLMGYMLAFLFVLFVMATLLDLVLWSDVLSLVNMLADACLLWLVFRKSIKRFSVRSPYLLLSFACLAWAVGDFGWLLIDISGGDAGSNQILWVIYTLSNVLLAAAFMIMWLKTFTRWNTVQLIADILCITALSGMFLWVFFLQKDAANIARVVLADFTSIPSVILDVFIGVGVFQWIVSIRSGKMTPTMFVVSLCANLFALVDIGYYYILFWKLSIPSSITDILYVLSFNGMAISGLINLCSAPDCAPLSGFSNIGLRRRWPVLLMFPAGIFLLKFTGIIQVSVTLTDYLFFFLLIFLHWVFSRYIQLSIENERLLNLEKLNTATLEKRVAEQVRAIANLANQDNLTELNNRRYFLETLEAAAKTTAEPDTLIVVIMDIDRFKMINDTYGPDIGDATLCAFSQRLSAWNHNHAILARMGGDEFALLHPCAPPDQSLTALCEELVTLFSQPLQVVQNRIGITISIGAAAQSAEIRDAGLLLQSAEIALHQAKSQGYGHYQIFDPLYSRDTMNATRIELMLRGADVEKEFKLYYQPQFALPEQRLIGAEALLRWKNSEHGFIAPSFFIPIAEKIGMIGKIGHWVFGEALRQAAEWSRLQYSPLRIGINVSPLQLDDGAFLDTTKAQLGNAAVDPSWLDIEITENVMIRNTNETREVFQTFRNLGFTISIDDFGTGYSSMGYLSQYAFDRLKIDKSLIDSLLSPNGSGALIVKSIIDMSKTLGIKTIAEGVEKEEQLNLLIRLGCDQIQGYLLGRPVPADEFCRMFM